MTHAVWSLPLELIDGNGPSMIVVDNAVRPAVSVTEMMAPMQPPPLQPVKLVRLRRRRTRQRRGVPSPVSSNQKVVGRASVLTTHSRWEAEAIGISCWQEISANTNAARNLLLVPQHHDNTPPKNLYIIEQGREGIKQSDGLDQKTGCGYYQGHSLRSMMATNSKDVNKCVLRSPYRAGSKIDFSPGMRKPRRQKSFEEEVPEKRETVVILEEALSMMATVKLME